jgi:hypothetical protein
MRLVLLTLPQLFVMAGVVTTALCVPVGGVLALLARALFGVSLRSFVTFGEALGIVEGVLAWWAVLFVPALVYSAFTMPWGARKD